MKCTPDKNDPFSFEGPEIYKCKVKLLFDLINFQVYYDTKVRIFFVGLRDRLEKRQKCYDKNY